MKKVCVANWKMHGSLKMVSSFISSLSADLPINNNIEVVLCIPSCYLSFAKDQIMQRKLDVALGAQNCHWKDYGPFTGEISASMLYDLGCSYVILGHLENRDNNILLLEKRIESALKNNLKVILCASEVDLENKNLFAFLNNLKSESDIMIAYEPISAIGTGIIPNYNDLALIINQFKRQLRYKIIYGGSVSKNNVDDLSSSINIDGFLIGKASLDADSFCKIVELIK